MNNIFLIGFMGCGKSTVSSYMAQNCGMEVIEMDEEIARREEMSISEIFDHKGEVYFRDVESKLLQELTKQKDKVVSCGGGVVLKEQNIKMMKQSGDIILLTATPDTIYERLKDDDSRPLMKGNKNMDSIRKLLENRMSQYEMAADYVVQTDDKDVKDICKEILDYRR